MKEQDLQTVLESAELMNYRPYIDADLEKMKKTVVSQVMLLAGDNRLTAEIALTKWLEYIALVRLGQHIGQKITAGVSLGVNMPKEL